MGSKGYGLKIVEQTETTVKFEGGGGLVDVSADKINSKTEVDLFSREWEYQTKEFIRSKNRQMKHYRIVTFGKLKLV